MSYISVDVDIDDIVYSMSDRDKQELVDELYEDGFIPKSMSLYDNPKTPFDEACLKLFNEGWRLTREEEEFIINISKRF
jgi:hypothetical protein